MAGVFRPYPRVPWLRQRRVLVASPPAPIPENGTSVIGVTGAGAATKRASVTGSSSLVIVSSGAAAKSRAHVGSSSVAVVATSTPKKVGTPQSSAAVGLQASGIPTRVAQPIALGVVGLVGHQSGTRVAELAGRSHIGLVGTGVAYKIGAVRGSTTFAVTGTGAAAKRRAQTGTTDLGLATTGRAEKRVQPLTAGALGVTGTSRAVKVATPVSRGTVGLSCYQQGPLAHSATGQARLAVTSSAVSVKVATPLAYAPIVLSGQTNMDVLGIASQGGIGVIVLESSSKSVLEVAQTGSANIRLDSYALGNKRTAQIGRSVLLLHGRAHSGITTGTRISPPLALLEAPVAGSIIMWRTTTPGASTVLVETSVDNGATWQVATNGEPIPRLIEGTSSARTVMTRITLTRPTADDPTPRVHYLEVRVDQNASQPEFCPLGAFTLNDVIVNDTPSGLEIELSGADLSRRVSRNRWDKTYVIAEGTNYGQAIYQVVNNRLPGLTYNFASTTRVTPRLFFGEQSSNDPWQDAQDMASAIGMELFFDARGVCTLRPEPDPEFDDSVWEFEDQSRPTLTNLSRRVTDENTYNKVVVTGEGTSNEIPVRAVAIDDDPASPTYHLGPYGTVTLRVTNSMVLTTEQAQDAANAALRKVKGATEAVELDAVPMPALEPGDVVTVTRGRAKVEGRFIIDTLRMPLGAEETMHATGRRQRQ